MTGISVIVVTWNSINFIERCLSPLRGVPDIRVIVFDNASTDGTPDFVRAHFPFVEVFESAQNLGFGRGNNMAVERVDSEYVLFLNPDAFLNDKAALQLDKLCSVLRHSDTVGAVGPMLLHPDGSHQVGDAGWQTSLVSAIGHSFGLHRLIERWPSIYISNKRAMQKSQVEVGWICGACLMVRRADFVAVGGFSEDIFMYGEDVDLGEKLQSVGKKSVYVPEVKVTHLQGASQKEAGELYYSTKWLDHRLQKYKAVYPHWRHIVLVNIFRFGFILKKYAYLFISLRRKKYSANVKLMDKFISHIEQYGIKK